VVVGGEVVSFEGDVELGQVAVADDPSKLRLAMSMPAAVQRLRMSPLYRRLTLRWV
jgi:hypothetical protein